MNITRCRERAKDIRGVYRIVGASSDTEGRLAREGERGGGAALKWPVVEG